MSLAYVALLAHEAPNLTAKVRIKARRAIYSVAFSPKGKDIATAGSDKTIRIWDLSTLRPATNP
jgi:WD40 repeat protein